MNLSIITNLCYYLFIYLFHTIIGIPYDGSAGDAEIVLFAGTSFNLSDSITNSYCFVDPTTPGYCSVPYSWDDSVRGSIMNFYLAESDPNTNIEYGQGLTFKFNSASVNYYPVSSSTGPSSTGPSSSSHPLSASSSSGSLSTTTATASTGPISTASSGAGSSTNAGFHRFYSDLQTPFARIILFNLISMGLLAAIA